MASRDLEDAEAAAFPVELQTGVGYASRQKVDVLALHQLQFEHRSHCRQRSDNLDSLL